MVTLTLSCGRLLVSTRSRHTNRALMTCCLLCSRVIAHPPPKLYGAGIRHDRGDPGMHLLGHLVGRFSTPVLLFQSLLLDLLTQTILHLKLERVDSDSWTAPERYTSWTQNQYVPILFL